MEENKMKTWQKIAVYTGLVALASCSPRNKYVTEYEGYIGKDYVTASKTLIHGKENVTNYNMKVVKPTKKILYVDLRNDRALDFMTETSPGETPKTLKEGKDFKEGYSEYAKLRLKIDSINNTYK
jgi:hypothetical protein